MYGIDWVNRKYPLKLLRFGFWIWSDTSSLVSCYIPVSIPVHPQVPNVSTLSTSGWNAGRNRFAYRPHYYVVLHICSYVYTFITHTPIAQVNARYPNAVDKRIRMTQFFHWSKDSSCMHPRAHTRCSVCPSMTSKFSIDVTYKFIRARKDAGPQSLVLHSHVTNLLFTSHMTCHRRNHQTNAKHRVN